MKTRFFRRAKLKGDVRGKFFYTGGGECLEPIAEGGSGADKIVAFKRLLDEHVKIQRTEGYGSRVGRVNLFKLALCSVPIVKAEGSCAIMSYVLYSLLYNNSH